jgi:hypothetical protein
MAHRHEHRPYSRLRAQRPPDGQEPEAVLDRHGLFGHRGPGVQVMRYLHGWSRYP